MAAIRLYGFTPWVHVAHHVYMYGLNGIQDGASLALRSAIFYNDSHFRCLETS